MAEPIFPSFPTSYTKRDIERQVELAAQRRALEQAYKVKFSPQAWAGTPMAERAVRRVTPPWLAGIVRTVTPGLEPTTEFGFTPGQWRESSDAIEQEYKELARKQKVTSLLPNIQADLMVSALAGEHYTDISSLKEEFPELRSDFSDEELNYLARLGQALSWATPEQLLSGELFASEPNQLPLSDEDITDLFRQGYQDPRNIFATIEFSKDLEGVTQALKEAFPAQTPEDEAKARLEQQFRDYFKQRNQELGITSEGAVPTAQAIQAQHEAIAQQVGKALTLTNDQGELFVARRMSNNEVYIGDEKVGYYNEETQAIAPFGIHGQPLLTEEAKEGALKDLYDAWVLASNRAGFNVGELPNILGDAFLNLSEKAAPFTVIGDKEAKENSVAWIQGLRARLKQRYEIDQLEFQDWLKEHPELNPRPEWAKPVESPRDFFDPGRIAYLIASNAPVMASAATVGIGTGILTGNPWTGAIAASAVMTPVMIADIQQDAMENGASFEDASALATTVGIAMGAVEIAPWVVALKIINPAFMGVFRKTVTKEATKVIVQNLTARGVIGTGAKAVVKGYLPIVVTEILEENIQQIMQNAAVKVFNSDRSLTEGLGQTTMDTFWAVSPLAFMGGISSYMGMKSNLPPKVQQQIDTTATKMKEAGLSEEHAEAVGLAQVLETETGRAMVEEAMEKAPVTPPVEVIPPTPGGIPTQITNQMEVALKSRGYTQKEINQMKPQVAVDILGVTPEVTEATQSRITFLQSKIATYNEEIQVSRSSIATYQDRLSRMTLSSSEQAEIQDTIKTLEDRIVELEGDKQSTTESLDKLRRPVQTPELFEALINDGERLAAQNPEATEFRIAVEEAKAAKTPEEQRLALIKMESLEEQLIAPTLDSIVSKLIRGERLNITETQFYNQNMLAIDELLSQRSVENQAIREQLRAAMEKALPGIRKLIPDLTYLPNEALPKLPDLEEEMDNFRDVLNDNPNLKNLIKAPHKVLSFYDTASSIITDLRAAIEIAIENKAEGWEDLVKEKEAELKAIAKKASLSSKTFLTKGFGDLGTLDKAKVALSFVPDHSIFAGIVDDFRDTPLVYSSIQKETGLPFLRILERIEQVRGYCLRLQDEYYKRIVNNPKWRKIVRDGKKMEQVALIIDSRRPDSKTVVSDPVTDEDFLMVEVADAMEAVFREWQPVVRFQRFIEAYENNSDPNAIHEKIKDAPIEDLTNAVTILEESGEESLWRFLSDKEWGVYKSGYSPWRVAVPSLEREEPSWASVRGASYLMSRDSVEMPWDAKKGFLASYDSYNLSMALRFFLRKEVQNLANMFQSSWDKWNNPEHVQSYLRKHLRAIQGFPDEESNFFNRVMRRILSWAHPNIFWHPVVGFRNIVQFVWSFPYRTELVRGIWEFRSLPASLRNKANERFAISIDQTGRPLRNWMFQDEEISILGEVPEWVKRVTTPLGYVAKSLDFLSHQTAKIPTIAFTDKASRMAAFKAGLSKAWRATERYMKDGNARRWFNQSGINNAYITREQQEHIIGLLALGNKTISWSVAGLQEVSGYEAASIRIAEETAQRTLYVYDKALAAGIHRGSGRALASLFTFPRSTVQMYAQQLARVIAKDSSVGERIAASKNILLLWIVGEVLSLAFASLTNRDRKEYSIVNTITWGFGGLGVGLASDVFNFLSDSMLAAFGSKEDKERVISRLPTEATRLGDVLVGFYGLLMDTLEVALDEEKGIDIAFLRKVRSMLDENYTPEEREKANRNVIEMVQKILFKADAPDPILFEQVQLDLLGAETQIGTIGLDGSFFTLGDYASKAQSSLDKIPDYIVDDNAGFSDLFLFYYASKSSWDELYALPSTQREDWRKAHVEEEAMLLFWEKYSKSVFNKGTSEANQVHSLLRMWFDIHGIDRSKHQQWSSWALPVPIP
uniref:Uncharacterized protein n=1 Tax=viral metagenome TaxID=1070528 RepID=A0A6M3KKP8_9ZZZZ